MDNPHRRGKPTVIIRLEGSSSKRVIGKREGHHRDRRPGHVHRGATHEPGRAYCLLGNNSRRIRGTGVSRALALNEPHLLANELLETARTQTKGSDKVLGRERKRTNPRRAEAVLAELSTDGCGEKSATE